MLEAKTTMEQFKIALESQGLKCKGGNPELILYFEDEDETMYKLWFQNEVIKFCSMGIEDLKDVNEKNKEGKQIKRNKSI